LRVVSGPGQCRPSEVSIFWNQEGPEGPPGPPGLPGPPGTTNLLFVRQDPASPVTLANAETQVLSLTVPAGTYAISAKVSVANADTLIPQAASCKLSTGDVSAVVLGPDDNEQVISLLDAFTFPSETAIILSCNTLNGTATGGFLAAVEVELPTP